MCCCACPLKSPGFSRNGWRRSSLIAPPASCRCCARRVEGKDYVSRFGERQTGKGPYADLIAARFELALKRFGLNWRHLKLRTDQFRPPGGVLSLFQGDGGLAAEEAAGIALSRLDRRH